ncbi:MAG TPA: ribonuclease Z [Clostridiaceae bacterium]
MVNISLLGTGGTLPLPDRYLASLSINYEGYGILVDCGEGTQVAIKKFHRGYKNIEVICITHFHADHVSGIPGILLTIGNSGREEPITIIGPMGLTRILEGLLIIVPILPFKIKVIEVEVPSENIYKMKDLTIGVIFLDHSITCLGFSFKITRKREFLVHKAEKLNIPIENWKQLQNGLEILEKGIKYIPDMVLGDKRKGIKITYCTDTRAIPDIVDFAKLSDLFICEATYGDNEDLNKAIENKHMLFREAAELSDKANVKELWLTHFSTALKKPDIYINNAKDIFANTKVGIDGMSKELNF